MKRWFRENAQLLIGQPGFVQFEGLYKLIGILALMPAVLALFNLSVHLAGLSYITNDNLWRYLKNPATLFLVIVLLFLMAFYVLVEMAAMSLHFHLQRFGRRLGIVQMFTNAVRCAIRVFRPRNLLMVPFLVLLLPLTSVPLLSGYVATIDIPDFIVKYVFSRRTLFLGLLAFFGLFFLLAVRWMFSVSYFVLEQQPFRKACRSSARLIKGHYFSVLGRVLLWELAANAVLFLLYLLFLGAALLFSKTLAPGSSGMSIFLEIFRWANVWVLLLGSCLNIPILFTAVSSQFYRLKSEKLEGGLFPREMGLSAGKGGSVRRIWFAAGALIAVMALSAAYILPTVNRGQFGAIELLQQPQITSHRGNSTYAPENTLAAFQAAVDDQADYIELDVQQLADGTIIVMHDNNFRRTARVDRNVWETKWDEVQNFDVGSWFSPEFAGERVPTLEEVLAFADGKIHLNIELKPSGHEKNLEEEVARLVKAYHFENKCVITSLQYSALRRIKEIAPELQTGYVLSVAYGRFYDMEDVDLFSIRAEFITAAMVRELHNRDRFIYAWTVNDGDEMERLTDLRVDNIITDDPKRARSVISAGHTNSELLTIFQRFFTDHAFSTTAKDFWHAFRK